VRREGDLWGSGRAVNVNRVRVCGIIGSRYTRT